MTIDERVRQLLDAGDASAAATEALRAFGPEILRYLRSMLRNEDDAADAFSAFAENVWKGLERFRGESSLRTWAFRIAWHAALDFRDDAWRRHGRRLVTGEATAIAEEIRTKTVVRHARQEQALDKLREQLSPQDQSLLALRVDQGFSWQEIAEILAASGEVVQAVTLKKRFERLKDRLGEMARDQGFLE